MTKITIDSPNSTSKDQKTRRIRKYRNSNWTSHVAANHAEPGTPSDGYRAEDTSRSPMLSQTTKRQLHVHLYLWKA
jgi:hypothetical protein